MISNGGPYDEPEEIRWGVSPDPAPPRRSVVAQAAWIVLSILIILSLVLPWILPYFRSRPEPVREGLQALFVFVSHF